MLDILSGKGFSLNVLSDSSLFSDSIDGRDKIYYYKDLEKIIDDSDVIIAPMSSTDENCRLKATFINEDIYLDEKFFNKIAAEKGKKFVIGIARDKVKKQLESRNIKYFELARLDDIAIFNAIPTAEGAIKIAIEETDFTLFNSNILTFGLGKVGLTLAWRLKMLGANSYAVTRNEAAAARGSDLGLNMLTYDRLDALFPQIDIIFNTVPALIITEDEINKCKSNTLIIDLASAPGGVDFDAADKKNIRAILALGLPGKVAPMTAGKILADKIPKLLETV